MYNMDNGLLDGGHNRDISRDSKRTTIVDNP